jgi:hypothetical protein
MHQNYFSRQLSQIFTLKPITEDGPNSPSPFSAKTGNILRNLARVSLSRRLSRLHSDEKSPHPITITEEVGQTMPPTA